MLGQFVTDHPLLGVEDAADGADDLSDPRPRGSRRRRARGARRDHRRARPQVHEARGALRAVPARGSHRRRRGRRVPERVRGGARAVRARPDRARRPGGSTGAGASSRSAPAEVQGARARWPATTGPGVLVVDLPAAVCSPGVLDEAQDPARGLAGRGAGAAAVPVLQGVQPLSLGAFTVNGQGSLLDELRHLLGPVRGAARARDGLSRRPVSFARCRSTLLPAIDLTAGGSALYTPDGPVAGRGVRRRPAGGRDRVPSPPGARWLHVVDMDLAFGGVATNLERRPRDRGDPRRRACRRAAVCAPASRSTPSARLGASPGRGRPRPRWPTRQAWPRSSSGRGRARSLFGIEVVGGPDPRARRPTSWTST